MSVVFSDGEFERRAALARQALVESQADALLVDHAELMSWLSGYTVSETMYRSLVLPLEGEPWFVLRELDAAPCKQQSRVRQIVTFRDDEDPWEAVASSLRERGLGHCRLAADFHSYGFTVHTWRRLQELLPEVVWVDCTGISDRLRSVKSEPELAVLRTAANVADQTMRRIADQVRRGWTVRAVAGLAAQTFLSAGADSGETGPIVRASGQMGFLHAQCHDDVLEQGDVLHVELTPKVASYSARLMRPFVVGEPSASLCGAMQLLVSAQDTQIEHMRAGARADEVDEILRRRLLESGLRSDYVNVTGYSLGLYGRTPRSSDFSFCFTPKAAWRLQENMVFHMYASASGFAFSETVVVTPDGGRCLTSTPRRCFRI